MTMPSDAVLSQEEMDRINAELQEEYARRLEAEQGERDYGVDDPPLTAQEQRMAGFLEEGRA